MFDLAHKLMMAVTGLALIAAFSEARKPPVWPALDPELEPFLDDFLAEGKVRGVNLNRNLIGAMVYVDIPAKWVGFCNSIDKSWEKEGIEQIVVIQIDKVFRGTPRTDYCFRALVYHELSHCLLYQGHETNILLDSYSIMSATPLDQPLSYSDMCAFYEKTWDRQLDWLFRVKKVNPYIMEDFLK